MKKNNFKIFLRSFTLIIFIIGFFFNTSSHASESYEDLVSLFKEWRAFEKPPMLDGAPDYTADTFAKRYESFKEYKKRLHEIDHSKWPVKQKVDWYVLLAELNGFDFNYRVLKPWVRDPAFYKSIWTEESDVPAHEGPTHHAVTELWTYTFPLTKDEEKRLINDLKIIAPLNRQAQKNLTGNARELWITGIRDIREQSAVLDDIKEKVINTASQQLIMIIAKAKKTTDELVNWLEQQAPLKTGPSGIGKENYTWYQQNVHLLPLTWEEEETVLKHELARAWSSLKMEEHRNRDLPPLIAASSEEEYRVLAERSIEKFLAFLKDREIMTVEDYFEPVLREQSGRFVPEEDRNFFLIGSHYDPMPLFSHFYHWFEKARMKKYPHESILRRNPLLYNIFDSRDEGAATAVEELFMQCGLYDDNPHAREIVYIMIAQRAARGLGSLYAHANIKTMEEAGKVHAEWTPRGWVNTKGKLLIFEQHLYMRQPGYGTSYITGKYLFEGIIADYARLKEKQNESFKLKNFMDEFNAVGSIPMSLVCWQLTGLDGQISMMLGMK